MQLNPEHRYFWDQIHSLFGTILVFDRDLRIVYASERATRHMPALENTPDLLDVFTLQRPASIGSFADAAAQVGALFLMVAKDESFALRGQVIQYDNQGEDVLIFCGAPWLFWMTTNRPEVKLGLQDFSAQDVQLDQLFYMSTEKRMVDDLEALNAQLQDAKHQLEEAQQAKSAFFAQMSHEMRTPLNGVVSALALLREKSMPREAKELLELAQSSSRNLLRVINYVLDVSKIEAEESLELRPFRVADLLSSTTEIVAARAREKSIALDYHIDPALSEYYEGDPDRLQQSLLNLVVNAIKFTDQGSVSVEVVPAQAADCSVRFEVNDTGIGIAKADQARIFEPFVSDRPGSANSSEQGTGLGLDIVRRSAETMNGRVGVSSAPGSGSSFWIELPLTEADAPPAAHKNLRGTDSATIGEVGADVRILLVDDNETNLMLGTMLFESLGVSVTPAATGEEAVRLANPADMDIVFMDISMPGMDGYEATRAIRKTYDSEALPIVALSAYASSIERTKAEEAGMDDYLTKPMNPEDGVAVIQRLLADAPPAEVASGEDQADSTKLVDKAVLQNLHAQIGTDNLNTVIGKFLEEARQRWNALENAADYATRAREAHTLASTCGSFGLPIAASELRTVELAAQQETPCDPAQLEALGALLRRSLERLSHALPDL